jgi:hypothetical protein
MDPVYMSDWARLVEGANAIPVFDLNMVTSSLDDQIDMLHAAEALGMPIRRLELGNELYYANRLVVEAIPTPEAYGRQATRWISALKARFPDAQIAAVGFGYRVHGGRARLRDWDHRVRKTLRGESAFTFHSYWKAPRGGRLSGARLSDALAAPLRRLRTLRVQAFHRLPPGVGAWVTEWNVRHGAGLRGTWANGLVDAAFLIGLLGERSVSQEDLHPLVHSKPLAALFGDAEAFGHGLHTVRFAPTAVGEAIRLLYPPLWGGVTVRRLKVPGGPRFAGTRLAAVRGAEVQGRGALFVNLTGKRQRLELDPELSCDGTLDSVWARPSARITGRPGQISHETRPADGSVALRSYSVSRLSCPSG